MNDHKLPLAVTNFASDLLPQTVLTVEKTPKRSRELFKPPFVNVTVRLTYIHGNYIGYTFTIDQAKILRGLLDDAIKGAEEMVK